MDKEQVYDAEISPLMGKIIAICKRSGIACLCTFDLATEDNDGLACTTFLPDGDGVFPDHLKRGYDAVGPKSNPIFAFTVTSPSKGRPRTL
jgi:hypothetical protein